jgi:periodic tryptophan protein 1
MISSVIWVKRGKAAEFPNQANYTEEELQEIQEKLGVQLEQSKQELQDLQDQIDVEDQQENDSLKENDDFNSRYNLDSYDEPSEATVFSNVKDLIEEDDQFMQENEELNEEEKEEVRIDPLDNLLLACKTEDEVSCLEVYVYEQEEDNLYVHHDILLPSFPLCAEWLDFCPKTGGNGNSFFD